MTSVKASTRTEYVCVDSKAEAAAYVDSDDHENIYRAQLAPVEARMWAGNGILGLVSAFSSLLFVLFVTIFVYMTCIIF